MPVALLALSTAGVQKISIALLIQSIDLFARFVVQRNDAYLPLLHGWREKEFGFAGFKLAEGLLIRRNQ